MHLARKIAIRNPSPDAETYLRKSAGVRRLAYNWANENYRKALDSLRDAGEGKFPSASALRKLWNETRKEKFPFTYEVSKCVGSQAVMDLCDAFSKAFAERKEAKKKGRKVRKNAGFPKFKSRNRTTPSFTLWNDQFAVTNVYSLTKAYAVMRLPNFGEVRLAEPVPSVGGITRATVSLWRGKWHVTFSYDLQWNDGEKSKKAATVEQGRLRKARIAELVADGLDEAEAKARAEAEISVESSSPDRLQPLHPKPGTVGGGDVGTASLYVGRVIEHDGSEETLIFGNAFRGDRCPKRRRRTKRQKRMQRRISKATQLKKAQKVAVERAAMTKAARKKLGMPERTVEGHSREDRRTPLWWLPDDLRKAAEALSNTPPVEGLSREELRAALSTLTRDDILAIKKGRPEGVSIRRCKLAEAHRRAALARAVGRPLLQEVPLPLPPVTKAEVEAAKAELSESEIASALRGVSRADVARVAPEAWSNRQRRLQDRVNRLHWADAHRRDDAIHKASRRIADGAEIIVLENLNLAGLMRGTVAAELGKAGLGRLSWCIGYKAELNGGLVLKAPRFFPSTKRCGSCGHVVDELGSVRSWVCPSCGVHHDRDGNAADNLCLLAELAAGDGPVPDSLSEWAWWVDEARAAVSEWRLRREEALRFGDEVFDDPAASAGSRVGGAEVSLGRATSELTRGEMADRGSVRRSSDAVVEPRTTMEDSSGA